MSKLSKEEWAIHAPHLTSWIYDHDSLIQVFECTSFLQSIAFVNRVAVLAEQANHHPDMWIRYRRVTVILTTHDEQGVTLRDVALAEEIDQLYENREGFK